MPTNDDTLLPLHNQQLRNRAVPIEIAMAHPNQNISQLGNFERSGGGYDFRIQGDTLLAKTTGAVEWVVAHEQQILETAIKVLPVAGLFVSGLGRSIEAADKYGTFISGANGIVMMYGQITNPFRQEPAPFDTKKFSAGGIQVVGAATAAWGPKGAVQTFGLVLQATGQLAQVALEYYQQIHREQTHKQVVSELTAELAAAMASLQAAQPTASHAPSRENSPDRSSQTTADGRNSSITAQQAAASASSRESSPNPDPVPVQSVLPADPLKYMPAAVASSGVKGPPWGGVRRTNTTVSTGSNLSNNAPESDPSPAASTAPPQKGKQKMR